jgi:hypothetical protein
MVEGIVYRYPCGIAWRDLPEVFGALQLARNNSDLQQGYKHESGSLI